jgi:hypothetical protein
LIELDGSLTSKQAFLALIKYYFDNNNDHYSSLEVDNCFIMYHYLSNGILTPEAASEGIRDRGMVKITPIERLCLPNQGALRLHNTNPRFPNTMDLDLVGTLQYKIILRSSYVSIQEFQYLLRDLYAKLKGKNVNLLGLKKVFLYLNVAGANAGLPCDQICNICTSLLGISKSSAHTSKVV